MNRQNNTLFLSFISVLLICAAIFTRVQIGNNTLNAYVTVITLILFSIFILAASRGVVSLPRLWTLYTFWVLISVLYIYLRQSETLAPIQQFLVWILFIQSFTLARNLLSKKDIKKILYVILFSVLLWFAIGIGINRSLSDRPLASVVSLYASALYAYQFIDKNNWLKWATVSLIAMSFTIITESRMASVACMGSIIITEFLFMWSYRNQVVQRIPILIIFTVLVFLVTLSYSPFTDRLLLAFKALDTLIRGQQVDPGWLAYVSSGRSTVWPILWQLFLEKPIFGHGFGSSSTNAFLISLNSRFGHAHNEYLRILFDTGIIGFVLYFGGFASILRSFVRRLRTRKSINSLLGIGVFTNAVFLFATDNIGFYSFYMIPLGILLGIASKKFYDTENHIYARS